MRGPASVPPRSTLRQSAAAARLHALPVGARMAQMLCGNAELREVGPRRYVTSDGVLHHINGRTLSAALRAGVLVQLSAGHYALARKAR